MVDTSRGRRHRADATWRRWTLAWLGGPTIGVANGAARDLAYRKRVGDLAAHQVSTATAIALFGIYFIWARSALAAPDRRRGPRGRRHVARPHRAVRVRLRALRRGAQWAELVADYDVTKGRVWALMPLWVAIGPASARALRRARRA